MSTARLEESGLAASRLASCRLPASDLEAGVRQLMAEHPPAQADRFGCYRVVDASRYVGMARTVECTVFDEFFGNGPTVMAEAYGPYDGHSFFLMVVDHELKQPAGVLRVITHSEMGLKVLNDIAREPISISTASVIENHHIEDLSGCWDVGTVAVLKPYRGGATNHLVSTMLYGMFYAECCRAGIEHVVAILDTHAYAQLTQMLGVPFIPIASSQPFTYMGSPSSWATYGHIPALLPAVEAHMKRLNPAMLQMLQPHLMRLIHAEGMPETIELR